MKKLIKPASPEKSIYYSDFSGKCFGEWYPPIELKIEFGYGSKYDGSILNFHLDDNDIENILSLLKTKLTENTKKEIKKTIDNLDKNYDDSIQSRDWTDCEYICNQNDLLKSLL